MDKPRPMRTRSPTYWDVTIRLFKPVWAVRGDQSYAPQSRWPEGSVALAWCKRGPELIRREISIIKQQTDRGFGVNLVPAVTDPVLLDEELSICFEEKIGVMVFFWDVRPEVIRERTTQGVW